MIALDYEGWWACWGRWTAGTAESAFTTELAGCGAIGGISAIVGPFLAPGLGSAIGALGGCEVGGIAGFVGGGLYGSATFCNQ